jgi:hypothetical protein
MTVIWQAVTDDQLERVEEASYFLQNNFCPTDAETMWSSDYFRWKLGQANPAGHGFLSLALLKGQVIGTVSLTKKRVLLNGVEYLGGEVGDSYTAISMRRNGRPYDLSAIDKNPLSYINRSIFGRLASDVRFRAEANGVSLIYGTPNKNAYSGWVKRLSYFDLREYENCSYTRPTARLFITRFPYARGVAFLIRILERGINATQAAVYKAKFGKGLSIEYGAPELLELDMLWERCRPIQGFSLVRDAIYWKHRYLEHPLVKYGFFCVRKSGQLQGVVTTRVAKIGGGQRVVYFTEWMLESAIEIEYLLSGIIQHYRDADIDMFNMWTQNGSKVARAAKANLFQPRLSVPIIFADTRLARELQAITDSIHFHLGSSDAV